MVSDKPYILLVNGPNLNRLGIRKPDVYGTVTLADIVGEVRDYAEARGVAVMDYQSNHEGDLIDFIQEHGPGSLGMLINPGALGHYGLALRDCVEDISKPTIEVHISNVHRREAFRHHLVLSEVCIGQVVGLGWQGYVLAAESLLRDLEREGR